MVVLAGDGALDPLALTALAHELDHALTDQAHGLPVDLDPRTDDPDAQLAGRALAEGDAVLLQTRFQLEALDPLELLGTAFGSPSLGPAMEALEHAPAYLRAELMFPYTTGLAFVCEHERDGGWVAVDELYRDPPRTTAEILFPERAGADPVDAPDSVAPRGFEPVRRQTFGAAPLLFLLQDAGVAGARDAVEGWRGGEVAQFRRGDDVAVRISLVTGDGGALCRVVDEWVEGLRADVEVACR
jgi:hypothetical protein